ncbi:KCTD10 isoform 8 [Pan troglodytes]|uniref:Potassium channel tetramerization domain containing 10 n=3 Tax=Hominidae TaxID=9604 RepID=S4R3Y7_HUMAN|nr:KCTD10 isoform 8 [Pan troglodytes]PNJ82879.1 KCTD10 isoform 8 [Pongo abelii]
MAGSSLTAVGSTLVRYSTTFETGRCLYPRAAGRSRSC